MVDQTIVKPLGLFKKIKIFVHGILYVTFTITTTKNVLVHQVISLDFEGIHWSSEWELVNCTHIF
jgi:hypothetical protein